MNVQNGKRKKKRRGIPGDIASLRRVLWSAIRRVEDLIELEDSDTILKAVSTLSTVSGVYLKIVAEHDVNVLLVTLEEELAAERSTDPARAA